MRTCANPGCGKAFDNRCKRQKVCSEHCRYEIERIEHLNAHAAVSDEEIAKAVRRCAEALKDGVSGKELKRRFGGHVYALARPQAGAIKGRSLNWIGVPV